MSCCGGSDLGGVLPRRYGGVCNCGGSQRRVEGRCEPEMRSCESGTRRDTTPSRPTGGCGRPNCPKIVYPPTEPPKVEWEYTNYNRINHKWPPTSIESEYPEYQDDFIYDESQLAQNYRSHDSDDDFTVEKIYNDRDYREDDNNYECYERVGGGCEDSRTNESTYLDHYYDKQSVDHQNSTGAPLHTGCPRCWEKRSSAEADSDWRGRKRVHF